MKNVDTRVKYTKSVLQKALLDILKEKNIDKVSVKELCEEAGINRGTFYLHYSTPNDVLLEIERSFMNDHLNIFSDYMIEASHKKSGRGMDKLEELFKVTLENIELCKILFGAHGNHKFNERIKNDFRKDVVDYWSYEFPELNKKHLDYIYDYVFAGSMSLVLNWIDDDNKTSISAEQLANRLDRLGHYAHLAVKEFI